MKTLYLLRHAKSSWDDPAAEDHDRPLNARGLEAAAQMGRHMRSQSYRPALVLCSTARRTRETWETVAARLDSPPPVHHVRGLYLATPDQMLELLRRTDEPAPSALIVAHSPGTEQLALLLAEPDGPRDARLRREQIAEKFPTAALAVLTLPVERWRDLAPGTARLDAFVRPRDL